MQLVGLDPYTGFFHALARGRPSLSLDAMEEFRPVVDALVLRIVRGGVLSPGDFRSGDGGSPPFLLTDVARKRYLAEYENCVNAKVPYPPTGERTALRRCIELQVRHLARVILGQDKVYRSFEM